MAEEGGDSKGRAAIAWRPAQALSLLLSVTFGIPPATSGQVWHLDPNPVLSIGGLTENPDYILSNVVGGLRLRDGRIVLADRFTNGLRVYSPDGVFLQDVGREGEGPGEYEFIRGMDRCSGSPVVAFDLHWDMKIYDSELNLAEERSAVLPGIGGTPAPIRLRAVRPLGRDGVG